MNHFEDKIQIAICRWMDNAGIFYHSVPNEARGRTMAEQISLMQMGLRPGVADMVIWIGKGRVAYMEVKSKTGRQRDAQMAFQQLCEKEGFPYRLVRTVEEAKEFIREVKECPESEL